MNVLVIGAGGFTGGFIVAEALRRGHNVWAGVRNSTSREYLTDPAIKFVEFDFDDPEQIASRLRETLPEGEKWGWIVYNLGATKCLRFSDFSRINYSYLKTFTEKLKETGMIPEKFLYMSSLSALGQGDEKRYTPFTERQIPAPNTRYGASKLKAEMQLAMSGIPHIILRPTGIYGPRDKDYFLMFECIDKGFDFSAGFRKQELTFLYVEDLARAVFDALEHSATGETYNIGYPTPYSQKQFRKLAKMALGKKFVIPLTVPLWGVKAVSVIAEKIGAASGKPSTLNSDKYNIMKQRNWKLDITKAKEGFGFNPRTDLEEGVRHSVAWYREKGWLK